MSYHELWTVLLNWKKEFTAREFSSTFASPDPNKVLHDMVKKGFLKRVKRGKYMVSSTEEYVTRRANIAEAYNILNDAGMQYALTGPDAVLLWTKGGYQVDRFLGFYPIHLKVKRRDLKKWQSFFSSKRQRFHVKGQQISQTLFGLFYVLYPEVDFKAEELNGFSVMPLKETVDFCQRNIYSYEPALEILDETYKLGLKVKYSETKTNFQ